MNPTLFISATTSAWPDSVTVNWRRLSHGLWRVPEGDIHAAYSAESFPRIAVFSHEGRVFTNCGVHFFGAVHAEADCYALIPVAEYRGPEQRQYTYEGREAAYRGEVFRLGPKVVGVATSLRRANGQTSSRSFVTRKRAEPAQEEIANERGTSHVCIPRQDDTCKPARLVQGCVAG